MNGLAVPAGRPPALGPMDAPRLALLLSIAAGLQFQIVVPLGASHLKLCPADLAALLGALLALAEWLHRRQAPWSAGFKPILLAFPTAALTMGLAVAYTRYGQVSNWALVGKYLGWFMLVAYLAAGASLVSQLGERALTLCMRLFCWLTILVNFVFYLPRFSYIFYLPPSAMLDIIERGKLALYDNLESSPVGNDNGSAVMLLCVLAIVLGSRMKSGTLFRAATSVILASLAGITIVLTGSRAGMVAGALLLPVAFAASAASRRLIIATVAVLGVFLGGAHLANIQHGPETGEAQSRLMPRRDSAESGVYDVSASNRLEATKAAVRMWLEHPLAGAGLGAFLAEQGAGGLIIHNTILWIMAEMGLVGLLAYGIFFVGVIRHLAKASRAPGDEGAPATEVLLILVAVGAMAMAHELLYQRAPWFLLGMALATYGTARPPARV